MCNIFKRPTTTNRFWYHRSLSEVCIQTEIVSIFFLYCIDSRIHFHVSFLFCKIFLFIIFWMEWVTGYTKDYKERDWIRLIGRSCLVLWRDTIVNNLSFKHVQWHVSLNCTHQNVNFLKIISFFTHGGRSTVYFEFYIN